VYRKFLDPNVSDDPLSNNLSILPKHSDSHRDHANAEGILFLANYYRDVGKYDVVQSYCSRLLDLHGPQGDEAKALLRELRALGDGAGFEASMELDQSVEAKSRFSLSSNSEYEFENARDGFSDDLEYSSA
jgi:hypothetical protein